MKKPEVSEVNRQVSLLKVNVENVLAKLFLALIPKEDLFAIIADQGDGTRLKERLIILEDEELALLRELYSYCEAQEDFTPIEPKKYVSKRKPYVEDEEEEDYYSDFIVEDKKEEPLPKHIEKILTRYNVEDDDA